MLLSLQGTFPRAILALAEPHASVPEGIVTASIGVAAMTPASADSTEALLESADTQLYRAKHAGRNRVRPTIEHRA